MKRAAKITMESMVLLLMAAVLGFGANGLHKRGIDPTRNYFDKVVSTEIAQKAAANMVKEKHAQHPYQEVDVEEVIRLFHDPESISGAVVFVDARADGPFSEGRIPGALQCDHYQLDSYIESVLEAAGAAEKVIVYCNGGQCEDSQFVCRELIDVFDVPYEKVFLFAGGITDWVAREQRVEKDER